jgi:hypothetical protein
MIMGHSWFIVCSLWFVVVEMMNVTSLKSFKVLRGSFGILN